MADTQAAADEARIAELRSQRTANLAKAREAKKARAEDAPAVAPKIEALEPTQLGKVAHNEEAKKAERIAKLKAARAALAPDAPPEKMVTARVTKKGDGRISTGDHAAGLGDLTHDRGEILTLPEATALELEERGFVEIED